ncbi:MAG: ROK family protein [Alteromonadaceae bacterium]|nr:ROK family protein [Alteromonadaceae bacterium]
MTNYIAAIEAGGTKFNCAVLDRSRAIVSEHRIATTTPEQTLSEVVAFFNTQREKGFDFAQMGVASFGPLDLHPESETFGFITATPKPHWSNTDLANHLAKALDCRVTLDTDVNGAALAEYLWGAAQNTKVSVYVTIGTGVGGGVIVNGQPLHGLIHPEVGHMYIGDIDGIKGACPFHGSCVEGLASGTAMREIWGVPAEQLPSDHRAWQVQADVLAAMCHNLMMTLSAEVIVLGGGVMNKPGLLENVRRSLAKRLANYLQLPKSTSLEQLIVLPGLADKAGIYGAYALATSR